MLIYISINQRDGVPAHILLKLVIYGNRFAGMRAGFLFYKVMLIAFMFSFCFETDNDSAFFSILAGKIVGNFAKK